MTKGTRRAVDEITLEKVGPANLDACGIGCLANRRSEGYRAKVEWLRDRFEEGLRFLLFRDGDGKALAFLEYVPGAFAWRPVDAEGWLFVHCLWVYPRGQKLGGLGGRLIRACIEEARVSRARGVVTMTSEGPWMAGQDVFLRNGFEPIAEAGRFQLLVHRLRKGPAPAFRDIAGNLAALRGLHVIYSAQCPLLPKSVNDLSAAAAEHGLKLEITRLRSAREAQNAPSHYGVFQLVWNGRLLSDHYVSRTRFETILRKEILRGAT